MNDTQDTKTVTPADELWQIQDKTNSDGSVDGEVTGWEKTSTRNGPRVIVSVRLPNGERFDDWMRWPGSADPSEYRFVRLVEYCGYDLSSADHLNGDSVPCRQTNGDWSIDVPYSPPIRERAHTLFVASALPAFLISTWRKCLDGESRANDAVDYAFLSAILISLWVCAVLVALILVGGLIELVGVVL